MLLAGLVLGCAPVAHAQETAERPDTGGDSVRISFDGLVQTQFNTTSTDAAENVELLLRRVRVGVNVRLNDFISGRIQPEFAAEAVELNEAYLLLTFNPALQLLAGKGGRPFGIIDAFTAGRILPIERGARIRGRSTLDQYRLLEEVAYAGRSTGIQVLGEPEGAPLGLTYAFGYFRGALDEEGGEPAEDIRQLAGRVVIKPLDRLQIGAALSSREFPCNSAACGGDDAERGAAYTVDAEYGTFGEPGIHLVGEYSAGVLNPFTDADYRSAQVWLAFRTPPFSQRITGIETLLRLSHSDPEGGLDPLGGLLITPGVNVYVGGNNHVMLNYDVWNPDEGDTASSLKAQLQLAF